MDLIADRSGSDSPIFRANMERILKEHAKKMDSEQTQGYADLTNPPARSYSTDGDSIIYSHSKLYRFLDMKKLRYPGSFNRYKRDRIYRFHNRIIMGHYNGIMKDLTYGAAEEVRENMRARFDNQNI